MSGTAENCRKKAAACERAAKRTRDPEIRLELLVLARAWNRLAETAEQQIAPLARFVSSHQNAWPGGSPRGQTSRSFAFLNRVQVSSQCSSLWLNS